MKKLLFISLVLVLASCNNDPIQYTFEGTVTSNIDQSYISNAEVKVYQKPFNNAISSNSFVLVGSTTTDVNGKYSVVFEREKVTEFKITIKKDGFFSKEIILGSGEISSENNNVINTGMDGISWANFTIQNAFPNDVADNLTLIFYSYRVDCDGCIEVDYNYFPGIVDTVLTYTNTAGNYLKFTHSDGSQANTDSLLMPLNDTVSYSIIY